MLQNYELLVCDIHREWVNSSSEICIKQDCKKKFNISCIDCIRKEHGDKIHTLNDFISLKRFMSKLNELSQSTPQCQKYNDILKPGLESLNKQAKDLLIKIDLLRTQLQQIVEEVASLIGEEEEYTRQQQDELEIIRSKQNDFYKLKQRNELDEYLKQMNQLVTVKDVNSGDFNLQLKSADLENNPNQVRIAQNQKRCEKSSKILIEIDAQIVGIINKLKSFDVKVVDQYFHPKLEFSQTLKHPNIKIIQKDTVQQIGHGTWSFCLSENKLPINQDSTWAFKINQSAGNFIMLGVAHPEIILQQRFTYSIWDQLYGGLYLLHGHNNGKTFTHYKKEENNVFCSFGFETGDIIYMLFQPIKKKIYFCKNQTKPYVSITLSPDREDYQPCVVLLHQNDSVQMLKNDKYKFDL